MRIDKLARMTRGWLIGNFDPAVMRTGDFEFGIKSYCAGDAEAWHYHKIATEITAIVSGEVCMNGRILTAGDIVTLAPGEGCDFTCRRDAVTAVIKSPGAPNDKYTELPQSLSGSAGDIASHDRFPSIPVENPVVSETPAHPAQGGPDA
jgi:hypothetical protein